MRSYLERVRRHQSENVAAVLQRTATTLKEHKNCSCSKHSGEFSPCLGRQIPTFAILGSCSARSRYVGFERYDKYVAQTGAGIEYGLMHSNPPDECEIRIRGRKSGLSRHPVHTGSTLIWTSYTGWAMSLHLRMSSPTFTYTKWALSKIFCQSYFEQILLCIILHEIWIDPPLSIGEAIPGYLERLLRRLNRVLQAPDLPRQQGVFICKQKLILHLVLCSCQDWCSKDWTASEMIASIFFSVHLVKGMLEFCLLWKKNLASNSASYRCSQLQLPLALTKSALLHLVQLQQVVEQVGR